MSIELTIPSKKDLRPRIAVIGVGGAGGNAVNNMMNASLEGVDFIVTNTDAQALSGNQAERRIQMGIQLTEGLGAGSDSEIGRAAAEEAISEICDQIQGMHMIFITAGMGGGTGTGASPVIARACREQGILTVGVVTKPFDFEGPRRMRSADNGILELSKAVDTLIIIPNQNLFRVATEKTGFVEAFAIADEVLHSGVASVTDLMTKSGLINLDFADVKMVMSEMGKAMMGTGESSGENRAIEAAEAAISNPLLEDDSMQGASGMLINITGGEDMTLYEVDEAANRIKKEVDMDANIIIGAIHDENLSGSMRVSVVATGIDTQFSQQQSSEPHVVKLETHNVPSAQNKEREVSTLKGEDVSHIAEVNDLNKIVSIPTENSIKKTVQRRKPIIPIIKHVNEKAMPDFLNQESVKPVMHALPKRSRSFLDKVLGLGRTEPENIAPVSQENEVKEDKSVENLSDNQTMLGIDNIANVAEIMDNHVAKTEATTGDLLNLEAPFVDMNREVDTQTSMETNTSEYDADKLDIPAFLRR